ncbi:MAG: beta-lactamase family protein [Myxococcales bacterium]|nr:beta-lactamase family protein [Myxococcales bacterium]
MRANHQSPRVGAARGAFAVVLAAACGGRAARPPAEPPPPPPSALPILADAPGLARWAERELADAPSAVIALYDRTGLRWSHGVGARDAHGGPPPDHATIYRIGSITKVVTATALLQLRDAGAVTLDDPLTRWVPELAPHVGGVTLRHLVTHTSGIPSLGDGSAPYTTATPPTEAAMLRALAGPLRFAPGSAFEYSNAGMAVAGLVVARASGQPWRAYADARVLTPLGMRTATWDRAAVPVDRLAIGVGPGGEVDMPHWQLGAFEPAGGLYASADDLAGLVRLALGDAPEVLASSSHAVAITDDPLPGHVGAAWLVGALDDDPLIGHAGSTSDYVTSLVALPTRGLAAVVLRAGGDDRRVECVAVELLRAAAHGTALGTCAPAAIDDATAARAGVALDRLLGLLAAPTVTDAALTATFAPDFLTAIPPAELRVGLRTLTDGAGACARWELLGTTDRGISATLACATGAVGVTLSVETAPPHRITSLGIE